MPESELTAAASQRDIARFLSEIEDAARHALSGMRHARKNCVAALALPDASPHPMLALGYQISTIEQRIEALLRAIAETPK